MSHENAPKTMAQPQTEHNVAEGGVSMRPPTFQLKANPIQRTEDECSTETTISPGNEGYSDLISNAKPDENTAAQVLGAGAARGRILHDLLLNHRPDVVKFVIGQASWSDADNVTCELLAQCTTTDLFDAPNDLLQVMYDSLNGGWIGADEMAYMSALMMVMQTKALLPQDEVCAQAPVEEQEKEKFDPTKLKAASEYKSGTGAGTLYGKSQKDSLGTMLKVENTKGTVSWQAGGKLMADEDAYYKALDDRYAKRNEVAADKITDNQKDLLEIARKAARDADYFSQVINSSETAKGAEIDYANAQLSNDAFTFSSVLKHRMGQYHKFMVAVGLYTTQKPKPGGQAALRDRPVAHKWSTEHYITQGKNKDATMGNFMTMFGDATYHNGDIIQDKDNFPWAKKEHFVDAEDKVTTDATKVDKDKTWDKIKAYVNTFNYRNNKSSLASEGYNSGDKKRYPNANSVGISNHIFGNALDLPTAGFIKAEDQVNDFVAWEFGLQRNVSGETWHFENTGRPTRTEETEGGN